MYLQLWGHTFNWCLFFWTLNEHKLLPDDRTKVLIADVVCLGKFYYMVANVVFLGPFLNSTTPTDYCDVTGCTCSTKSWRLTMRWVGGKAHYDVFNYVFATLPKGWSRMWIMLICYRYRYWYQDWARSRFQILGTVAALLSATFHNSLTWAMFAIDMHYFSVKRCKKVKYFRLRLRRTEEWSIFVRRA